MALSEARRKVGVRDATRRAARKSTVLAAGWLGVAVLGGCALTPREPFTAAQQAVATVPGFGAVRVWGDAAPFAIARAVIGPRLKPAPGRDINYLALSGGGAGGAFTAGLLGGWTATGTRPVFDVVSGVSTGALIAPFAFLGARYDALLAKLYTGGGAATVASEPQNPLSILAGDGLLDPEPLRRLVTSYTGPDLLAAVAAEHRRGRRLLVVTTNLDAQRPVVWDMGAIAASGRPDAPALFRDILLASASVPAIFPPVLIKAAAEGRAVEEMHVDGVTTAQIFVRPEILLGDGPVVPPALRRHIHVWAVVNNTLPSEFAVVPKGTLPIAYRSISTMMKEQAKGLVSTAYEVSRRLGLDFNLAYIDRSVPFDPAAPFASPYMDAVFAIGEREARSGTLWHKNLEGLSEPAPK